MSKFLLLLAIAASARAAQPSAPSPVAAPLRDLQWGQLNFLHTTDTHGWHAGHLQEPSYSADWGDYISFAHHMRDLADMEGFDMLLVDTGDRVEGNGLYDASDPKGNYTFDIFRHQQIDIICSGNHELYKQNSSENEYNITVPSFKGSYLASNIDIHDPTTGKVEPLARRYRKFTTKNQGIRITAFGFLYNFNGNANNTIVKRVEDTIKEQWFQDAIRDKETDLFVVIGHVAADSEEYKMIYNEIRGVQWDLPIQFFAGHTHIRDFKRFDKAATAIESGRYMETIGFLSLEGLNTGKKSEVTTQASPTVRRRYIDNNLFSLYHHSITNETTFPTDLGRNVTKQIARARKALKLDHRYGCAPRDLWVNRVDISNDESIFKWLQEQVFPAQFGKHDNSSTPKLVLSNTGAIRFDIFKGPFTIDSTYLVSPFTSGFGVIKNVEYKIASKLLEILNNEAPSLALINPRLDPNMLSGPEQLALQLKPDMAATGEAALSESRWRQAPLGDGPSLVPGYTTKDDLGDDGDDTLHSPIAYTKVPNCIQSSVEIPRNATSVDKVDVVFNEFLQPWMITALQFLGSKHEEKDIKRYAHGMTLTTIIADWVQEHWPCDD